jgi:hypothetical protein
MPVPPTHIRVNGHLYKKAIALGDDGKQAFDTLIQVWLGDGYRELFQQNFAHLPTDDLAMKMADKFGVYIGALAEETIPWERYAKQIKGEKEQ